MGTRYTSAAFRQIAGNPDTHSLSEDLEKTIESIIPNFDSINPSAAFLFVFDFTKMKYLFVSDSVRKVTGYSAAQWKNGGIDWVVTILYPDDAVRLAKLHSALFKFYYRLSKEQRKICRYAYELRVVRQDGAIIWMLQQGSFIDIGPGGKPAITFDILTDITAFKKDALMTLNISAGDQATILDFPYHENGTLSDREMEILRLISKGLSSKQVAETLNISLHTVNTHRKNMLKKTGHKDSTALVYFAKSNGLI